MVAVKADRPICANLNRCGCNWTADPARGRDADEAIRPQDVQVRLPVDWDSVDPIPPALAEIMARPGTVNPPLDDVVPGEPEPASHSVAR